MAAFLWVGLGVFLGSISVVLILALVAGGSDRVYSYEDLKDFVAADRRNGRRGAIPLTTIREIGNESRRS